MYKNAGTGKGSGISYIIKLSRVEGASSQRKIFINLHGSEQLQKITIFSSESNRSAIYEESCHRDVDNTFH